MFNKSTFFVFLRFYLAFKSLFGKQILTFKNSYNLKNFENFSIFVFSAVDLIENVAFNFSLAILFLFDRKNRKTSDATGW